MSNDILDKAMQAAKNLMIIEIKDRKTVIEKKLDELRNNGRMRLLNLQCEEILESEKSDIINNSPWLQKLVEATQTAIFQIGSENRFTPDEQEDCLSRCTNALTDDSGIITASNVLYDLSLKVKKDSYEIHYSVSGLLLPWASSTTFKILDYTFQPNEVAVFEEREKLRKEITELDDARYALTKKTSNMGDILLRVETDLLLKQIKSDAVGERSIGTIKDLMSKYLDNTALPGGMTLIE